MGLIYHHGLTRTHRGRRTLHPLDGAHVFHALGQRTFFRISVSVRTVLLEVKVADEEDPCGQESKGG